MTGKSLPLNARHGLYRVVLPVLGECARVPREAGDAYPYLERAAYEELGFWPSFADLPLPSDEDMRMHELPWGGAY